MPLPSRKTALTLAVVAVLAGGLALFLARDDWNWAKPAVRWAVGRSLGRALEIRGDLRVDLGLRTEITADGVHLANAPWAAAREMFSARQLNLRLRLLPLLVGRLKLERVVTDEAHLELERGPSGEGNWTFRRSAGSGAAPSLPAEISLRQSDLIFTDPSRPRAFNLHVDAAHSRVLGGVRLVAGKGTYQEESFDLQLALLGRPSESAARTRAALRAHVGSTSVAADGWIGDASATPRFEARFIARGQSLDDLWRLTGFPLPHSPAFRFAARVSYGDDKILFRRLSGRLGKSDLAGELAIDLPPGERMHIEADVRSRAIDLDDVEGFWGRPPREEPHEKPAASAASAVARAGQPSSVFPDMRFELSKLRVADAQIHFAAERVQGKTVLDHVRLAATLADGVLELRPLELGMSAGQLTTNAVLDARGEEPRLSAELVLRHVQLEQLLARAGSAHGAGGELAGRAELRTRGSSLHELARHADGEIGAVLQGGWISDPLLELVALHLGGYLRAKLDKDEPGPIRCLVGLFDAKQGLLTARSLLLDTSHVRIEGEGTIDLGREQLDLELEQHSKHITIGALRTPIEIAGPFVARTARLKAGPLLARGGAAAALGALHPLAALLALVDPGTDDKPAACSEALAEFREIAPTVAAAPPRSPASRAE